MLTCTAPAAAAAANHRKAPNFFRKPLLYTKIDYLKQLRNLKTRELRLNEQISFIAVFRAAYATAPKTVVSPQTL